MRRNEWTTASSVSAGIALLLLAQTPTTTLWDRDEPRFAQAAVEMLSSGDYLLPTFNGELRPQKPPLIYWLMTLSLRALGPSETAVRLWSPIALAVAGLATFAIGRRFWSARVGLVAMIVLALTPLTVVEGVAATADAVLLAAITVSIAIASAALTRPLTFLDAAFLGLALGIGMLVKGPVAIVLPVPIVVMAWWLARRSVPWRLRTMLLLILSTAMGVAIFACWFIPASLASMLGIATQGLLRENVGRLLEPMEGHGTPIALAPFYYPAVIALGFFPWVVFLPAVLRRIARDRAWSTPRDALLVTWMAWPLMLFTLSATKLPHYVLPLWPALALGVGVVLVEHGLAADERRWNADGKGPRYLIAACVAATLVFGLGVAPMLERYKPVPPLMAAVRDSAVSGPLFAYAFEEPSLVFYGKRPLVRLHSDAALWGWSKMPGDALLVAPRAAIDRIERTSGSLGLREIAARRGWNHVKGEQVELVAFVRSGGR